MSPVPSIKNTASQSQLTDTSIFPQHQ